MDRFYQEQALLYRKIRIRQQRHHRLVRILAAVVVFCTTYALILPAITMEKEPFCGLEEHEHTSSCYLEGYPFQCAQMSSADPVVHQHEGLCFDEEGLLQCSLPEVTEHLHEDSCYLVTPKVPCTLEETDGHAHSAQCWEHSEDWLCGLPETDGHRHDPDTCYDLGDTNICGMEEHPAHQHSDTCYAAEPSLCCRQEIVQPHSHTDSCYQSVQVKICLQDEAEPHMHGASCSVTQTQKTCPLSESDGHTHTGDCMQTVQELVCLITGDESHIHGEDCYYTYQNQVCGQEPSEGHHHSESCYTQTTTMVCTLAETGGHTHSEACYAMEQQKTCTLEETQGHLHSDACYQRQLLCQTEPTEGHTHTDVCKEKVLNCTLPEMPAHSHTESCLTKLVCTLEEIPAHHHDEICLGEESRELICILPEVQLHTHTEACSDPCELPQTEAHIHNEDCLMTEERAMASLTCTKEVHQHDEICYQELPPDEGYLCGFGSHTHSEECMDENGQLVCTIPEHVHDIACVLEEYDPTADMETAADWEATFSHIPKTGNWPEDVLAIARSQLGYKESERNCYLFEDGTIRGYTRYGAWYGSPYGDWCAMFVSFCLNYGGVEDFPLDAGCNTWAQQLQAIGAYHHQDGYTPKPGDLVFFDWEGDASLDHIGLVAQAAADGSVVTIEGNSDNLVRYCTYPAGDSRIASYGELPEGKPQTEAFTQSYTGPDYTVTVTYDSSANLPEDAKLTVREILPNSEEYNLYYNRAVQALESTDPAPVPLELLPEETYILARFFDISFVSEEVTVEPEAPVEVSITYLEQVELPKEDSGKVVHFAEEGIEILEPETNVSENQADTFTFTQNSFSVSGILVRALPGMSASLTHEYNEQTDAFLYNANYSKYYNANSPIGTAGSFHIVAFDTANLYTHTNGNVLANNLYANSNFGTNGITDELTYIQNYRQVNGGSASKNEHVLVLGSENALTLVDNGNAFAISGQKLDRPRNLIQDKDTAAAPFIDLNRVKAEVRQIGANLAGYEDCKLTVSSHEQYNQLILTNPDAVGILNVTPSSPAVFGKHRVLLDGFQSGHSGSIVINVNCAGYETVNLPNEALVVVDGQVQNTNEVVEFSNGKVLWNFLNASGVTINANRMTGMVIAPGATVNIQQNLNGTVVADVVNVRAESHRTDFTGKIVPQTEEDEDETERFITIQKIKAGYVGTTLAGARFELYMEENGEWAKISTDPIVTDGKGLFLLKGLIPDKAYQLREIEAPAGYLLATEAFDFWIPSAANVTAPQNAPANFKGTPLDSGDILNIPNKPDETADTTRLTLKKAWDAPTLHIPSRISVDIFQIATTEDEAAEPVLFKTIVLTQALNWELEVTDLPKSVTAEDGTVTTYSYTVQEHPIPGFKATYSENNARGITEETILITNTEAGEGYVLPETGGTGTRAYTLSGILLILLALICKAIPCVFKRRDMSSI